MHSIYGYQPRLPASDIGQQPVAGSKRSIAWRPSAFDHVLEVPCVPLVRRPPPVSGPRPEQIQSIASMQGGIGALQRQGTLASISTPVASEATPVQSPMVRDVTGVSAGSQRVSMDGSFGPGACARQASMQLTQGVWASTHTMPRDASRRSVLSRGTSGRTVPPLNVQRLHSSDSLPGSDSAEPRVGSAPMDHDREQEHQREHEHS